MDIVQVALLAVIIATLVGFYFFFASFATGAGYQPTPARVVRRMLGVAQLRPNEVLYDLGAGTGALVFAAARKYGARVVAIEVEPLRVLILHLRRAIGGPKERVTIRRANLFSVDLSEANVVVLFLWPAAMTRLRPQLESQLRSGSRVVSYWHPILEWVPEEVDRDLQVYLYRCPAPKAPTSAAPTSVVRGGA